MAIFVWYQSILLVLLLVVTYHIQSSIALLTRKEADHIRVDYKLSSIVKEFQKEKLFSQSPDASINDIMKHHQLVESFCINYMYEFYHHRCTYREYHELYEFIRLSYSKLYDPVSATLPYT